MYNNTIGGLKLIDPTSPSLAYTSSDDEVVNKKHLTNMLAGFTGGGEYVTLPEWGDDIIYTTDPLSPDKQIVKVTKPLNSDEIYTYKITGLTTYTGDTGMPNMPVTIRHFDRAYNVVRRVEIQNAIDHF
jgi:hypothetical protein